MPQPVTINAGDLDRLIVLQRKTTTKNDFGEAIETWSDLGVVWAMKSDLQGAEAVRAGEVAAQATTAFFVRYTFFNPPLSPRDRVLFNEAGGQPEDGQVFNITAVHEVGRRVAHQIVAWARTDQQ